MNSFLHLSLDVRSFEEVKANGKRHGVQRKSQIWELPAGREAPVRWAGEMDRRPTETKTAEGRSCKGGMKRGHWPMRRGAHSTEGGRAARAAI